MTDKIEVEFKDSIRISDGDKSFDTVRVYVTKQGKKLDVTLFGNGFYGGIHGMNEGGWEELKRGVDKLICEAKVWSEKCK
uniref:Uncharacterized protein n=1 Tax=viral metagenome TaxID=1070528 RepID=A0A6H1ZF42_9ZZZZ